MNKPPFGSDNGLSPGRHQAISCINAAILSIGPLGTKFSEIWIEIYAFSFVKMHLKMPSGKWRPSCLGLNVLTLCGLNWIFSIRKMVQKLFCREQFIPLVFDPGMHQGTCVTHVLWCILGSLTCGGGKTFPALPGHAHPQFYVSGKRPITVRNQGISSNGINLIIPEYPGLSIGRLNNCTDMFNDICT